MQSMKDEIARIISQIVIYLQDVWGISLVVLAVFCVIAAVKASSGFKRAVNIVFAVAALSLGTCVTVFTILSQRNEPWQYLQYGSFAFDLARIHNAAAVIAALLIIAALGVGAIVTGVYALRHPEQEGRKSAGQLISLIVSCGLLTVLCLISLPAALNSIPGHEFLNPYSQVQEKPVIYFYPETEAEVAVRLGAPETLTVSYPKYAADTGWRFTAFPDGTLVCGGREYPYLYYEFKRPVGFGDKGFVVPGEASAAFLEEKLGAMGFTQTEQAEFITYWLPRLAVNDCNRIEFLTGAEVDALMPLDITPAPDNILRVYMLFAACDASLAAALPEQDLPVLTRAGFTVVEWGGSELDRKDVAER